MFTLMPVQPELITVPLQWDLQLGTVSLLTLFFLKITLSIRDLLYFRINFRVSLSITVRKPAGILIGISSLSQVCLFLSISTTITTLIGGGMNHSLLTGPSAFTLALPNHHSPCNWSSVFKTCIWSCRLLQMHLIILGINTKLLTWPMNKDHIQNSQNI